MTSATSISRQAWVAGVLTLCCPGLGHLYVGRLTPGLSLFLVSLILVPVAALVAGIAASTAALAGLVAAFVILLLIWGFAVFDACRIAHQGKGSSGHEYQRLPVYALFLAAGVCSPVISAAYVRSSVLEAFYLPGESMAPVLQSGDRILVNKTRQRLERIARWDVIVFRAPEKRNQNFIKRIVGLPGDEVTIEENELRINGVRVAPAPAESGPNHDEPRNKGTDSTVPSGGPESRSRTQTVPPGMCFVVGDNWKHSLDSRAFGPVPIGDVIGVAEYIYLPGTNWGRFGVLR